MVPWEKQEARLVFGDGLQYERIRIHEDNLWTNAIDRIGRRIKKLPPSNVPNALTLGNHCFFPVKLLDQLVPVNHPEHCKQGWLIHELTHAWQYQHIGIRYLWYALLTQLRQKGMAYNFGGADGLLRLYRQGWNLNMFNMEQQGDIARTFYDRLARNEDVRAWMPFIEEFQKPR
jgi:hypothetical protein